MSMALPWPPSISGFFGDFILRYGVGSNVVGCQLSDKMVESDPKAPVYGLRSRLLNLETTLYD